MGKVNSALVLVRAFGLADASKRAAAMASASGILIGMGA